MQILLVEDEPSLKQLIGLNLRQEGFEVVSCSSAEEVFKVYIPGKFALAILDVMLPGMQGFELCERLKLMDSDLRVMFVSARGEVSDRVKGLKLGADDYLPKPFDLEEFLLRVHKLMTRKADDAQENFSIGDCQVNTKAFTVTRENVVHDLSMRETMLLRLLYNKKGGAVNRNEILEKVWFDEGSSNTRMVDNAVVKIRKILEDNPKKPQHLLSIRGVGYKLVD